MPASQTLFTNRAALKCLDLTSSLTKTTVLTYLRSIFRQHAKKDSFCVAI